MTAFHLHLHPSFPLLSSPTSPSLRQRHSSPFLLSPHSKPPFPLLTLSKLPILRPIPPRQLAVASSSAENNESEGSETPTPAAVAKWASLLSSRIVGGPDRILRLIAGGASTPICQFIDSPRTFLHSVDARTKLVWLLALVILPARSNIYMRLGLVLYLTILSVLVLPTHILKDQLGRVALLSGILFIMLGFASDGAPSLVQLRTPPPSLTGLPNVPSSLAGYSYVIMKLGPLQLTRKGLAVASTSACLTFTIFQSASLCLTTTTPEQLAFGLRWFMAPLAVVGMPVAEVILTLLLSLRFISLVFDEVRNAALGIIARRICWHQLTAIETLDVFFLYVRRIFKNIFSHAEQIAKAMIARGFRGDSTEHKFYFSQSSLGIADFLSVLTLIGLIGAAVMSEMALV